MSNEASRVLSALAIAVAVVVAASMMAEPRYQSFTSQNNPQGQIIRGVFDTRTGQVCYAVIPSSEADTEVRGDPFVRCAPAVAP